MADVDVLFPRLVSVGSRSYRVQGSANNCIAHAPERGEHAVGSRFINDEDEEPMPSTATEGDEEIDESLISQEGNQFVAKLSFPLPAPHHPMHLGPPPQPLTQPLTPPPATSELFPFLIGREGRTRKRIEAETGASLAIPRKPAGPGGAAGAGGGGGEVTIKGPTRAAVSSAYVRCQLAMAEALGGRHLDYNFFLSLPLASPAAVRQFEAFRRAVLNDPKVCPPSGSSGLDPSVFMAPPHLHLTLAMLKLYSDEARHRAAQVLDSLQPRVAALLEGRPLKVHLQGLEYMNDDPSAMHVLYLKVHDQTDPEAEGGSGGPLEGLCGPLEGLCDAVVEAFGGAGLLLPQDDRKVKLHATIINTRYRKRTDGAGAGGSAGGGGGRPERQPFDGRALLQEHGRLDLGIHTIEALHLSQRGAYGEDGYYRCAKRLALK
ncbi:hypothetical protein HYH03_014993 [Edaphochlamys debaryana]|uniref:K Homology domain-containing protein n=1 Tax=Edaphochlamys debaryana TaxID=47281 RepID=A0A835XLJ8_9CHLO|nr:hypothetical protein HYH03_014993 [Edaphochlamys debaryana]|eukprot:KAG2486288.1 hypothetical protein HYH03_014993 [Edaphochlamys debaryana]